MAKLKSCHAQARTTSEYIKQAKTLEENVSIGMQMSCEYKLGV